MEAELLAAGEAKIASLGGRAAEVQALVLANFPPKTLADVQTAFEGKVASGVPNAEVIKVGALVREQAAMAVDDLKAAELWLSIKTPEVADGNNFGVEVQAYVLGELKAMRGEVAGMIDTVRAYHLLRGTTLEKLVKPPTKTTDDESKVEVDGDKETKKSTKSSKTSASETAPLADYVKYIAALDTKEYHAAYTKLVDLRNCYVKADLILRKNAKRLADPRGDNEGTSSNYSSMF
jgi:hypothetical protein